MKYMYLIAFFLSVSSWSSLKAEEEIKDGLTHGNVQMTLQVGETTQLHVIEGFGAPNITTIDGEGKEVWIYRRHATVTRSKTKANSFGIFLGAAGGGVGGGGGVGQSNSTSGFEQFILIIEYWGIKDV